MAASHRTAVILVGGLGTRLGNLARGLPKPMVPVAGRPFLEYLVLQLHDAGFDRIVLASGHGAEAVRAHFGDGGAWGVSIAHSPEPEPLGTGGALCQAAALVDADRFLALNGDSYLAIDPGAVFAGVHDDVPAVLALRDVPNAARFGSVELTAAGSVKRFTEKTSLEGPGLVNAGIYAFARGVFDSLPPGQPSSLEHQLLPRLASEGRLRGLRFDAYFVDIGVPETYLALVADPTPLLRATGLAPRSPGPFDRGGS